MHTKQPQDQNFALKFGLPALAAYTIILGIANLSCDTAWRSLPIKQLCKQEVPEAIAEHPYLKVLNSTKGTALCLLGLGLTAYTLLPRRGVE